MSKHKLIGVVEQLCHLGELTFIISILSLSLIIQIVFHELPCPLCLLQRLGFFCIAIGLLMNLRFGFKPSHYAIVILGCLFTALVSLRQIALHVVPGTGGYGSPVLGYHLYTWSFILAMVILVATTLMMSVDRQYTAHVSNDRRLHWLIHSLFIFTIVLIGVNIVTVMLECGMSACPENPTAYALLTSSYLL